MDCFIDYIGLRGAISGILPDSGLYVNDLPGINLKSIDKVADSDQLTYQQVWNTIQKRAMKKFQMAIYSTLNHRYRLKTVIQSVDLLRQIDPVYYDPAPQWRGFSIELTFKNMQRIVASPFQSTIIQEVSLYLNGVPTNDVTVNIFDLNTGTILDTFLIKAATATVGWNRIKIGKRYTAFRLFVAYDATEVQGTNLYIPPTVEWECSSCVNWIYGFVFCNAYIRGAQTIVQEDFTDLAFGMQSYGLTGVFSVGCTYDALAWNNRYILGDALQYLLGAEIMIERLASDRINRYTTIDRDQAEANQEYFESQSTEMLKQALDGIDIRTSDCCIECNAPVTYREMITM
ncbi:MAG TPA: hypothetical protein VFE32_17440 [Puia sp.]|jgi:hypothetical protein|nr:hypothetical protein [Puia sp.]